MIKQIRARFLELGIVIDDNTSDMVAYWDKNLICRYANAVYVEWFGVNSEMMIGKMSIQTLLGSLFVHNLSYIEGALRGGEFGRVDHMIPW